MHSGQRWAAGVALVGLVAIGSELLYIHHQRSVALTPATPEVQGKYDPDDLVYLKKQRPSTLADLKQLDGTTVWVSAGGQMQYFAYAAHHADYSKEAGTLLGAEPLNIKDVLEQVKPKPVATRVPAGDKQVLLVFTMPRSSDPATQYAAPVGFKQGADYTFYSDDIFFYADPHQLYSHWGDKVWQAVDTHQVMAGMNERQVQLSLGQIFKSGTEQYGEGQAVFYNMGKPIAVTFVKNHVTAFRPEPSF